MQPRYPSGRRWINGAPDTAVTTRKAMYGLSVLRAITSRHPLLCTVEALPSSSFELCEMRRGLGMSLHHLWSFRPTENPGPFSSGFPISYISKCLLSLFSGTFQRLVNLLQALFHAVCCYRIFRLSPCDNVSQQVANKVHIVTGHLHHCRILMLLQFHKSSRLR